MPPTLPTAFAPAERAGSSERRAQSERLRSDVRSVALLDAFPEPAMVLNRHREIVLANGKLAALLGRPPEAIVGDRPGEALACIHARAAAHGCGTTDPCRDCGAVLAILACQRCGERVSRECRLSRLEEAHTVALDLRVTASPFELDGEPFVVLALRDTTDEKRRAVLEQIFFHDVLNDVGALQGVLSIIPELAPEEAAELARMASHLSEQVVEEIQAQRDLAAAERGELAPRFDEVEVERLLCDVVALYRFHTVARDKTLVAPPVAGSLRVWTDPTLLKRILGNLVKNAMEASVPGESVEIRSAGDGDCVVFEVRNAQAMPHETQRQIFQRSFSTKAARGRGVGTYSIKLLTERYLGGTVTFTSEKGEGTTFSVVLPRRSRG